MCIDLETKLGYAIAFQLNLDASAFFVSRKTMTSWAMTDSSWLLFIKHLFVEWFIANGLTVRAGYWLNKKV